MKHPLVLLPLICVFPALGPAYAEQIRQLDAHEHGRGALNIAIEGATVEMELEVPGADIVGFEYAATTDADRAAIAQAIAILARPLDLFALPAEAGCTVIEASAELESEAHDHDHAHDATHAHDDDHAHDHGHDHAHAEDHAHDHADDHAHDQAAAQHSEFSASYALSCANTDALTGITFAYFDQFQNARALTVQVVSESGAQAFDVTRQAPTLDLRTAF